MVALSGIYVADFLTTGPRHVVEAFLNTLRKMWKTSGPQFLSSDGELQFLGATIIMTSVGLMLHQHFYTEDFLKEYGPFVSARKRNTAGEPDHFKKQDPEPPDLSNTDHAEWVKRGQRILGGLLWLPTRTRPDLACPVSLAAQVLTKDIHLLKVRLRHLLQYLNTTRTLG